MFLIFRYLLGVFLLLLSCHYLATHRLAIGIKGALYAEAAWGLCHLLSLWGEVALADDVVCLGLVYLVDACGRNKVEPC